MRIAQTNLSNREKEILTLISYGYSTPDIADKLFLSRETIKTHRKRIIVKMNAKNAADLVRLAFQTHILGVRQLQFEH